jgi:hypothetical protein
MIPSLFNRFGQARFRRNLFFSGMLVLLIWHINQKSDYVSAPRLPYAPVVAHYDEAYYRLRLDSLRRALSFQKTYPPEYELQALLALSQYPELKQVPIQFQKVKKAMPMVAARPDPLNLFRLRRNWIYDVYISEEAPEQLAHDLFSRFSFNAQIGILGHELAHTLSYQDKTATDMIVIGIQYLFSDTYKGKFEQDTDRRAIAHGFGWQVLEYATHYRKNPRLNQQEITAIDQFYLNPSMVRDYMDSCGFYANQSDLKGTTSFPLPEAVSTDQQKSGL